MKNLIKIQALFCGVFLIVNTANAQNICEPSCSASISLNTAGSVQAVDAMLFTFSAGSELNLGSGGTINTAVQPANLDFSGGGLLSLTAADSITFGDNGFLSMAPGSNINATSFNIVNGNLTINDTAKVTLGTISVDGYLTITASEILALSDIQVSNDLDVSSGNLATNIVFSGAGEITVGSTGSISVDGSIISNIGTISVNDLNTNVGVIQLDAQPLVDLSALEGFEINAFDGTLCTVTGDECIADNGDIYKLVDGELIKQQEGSGSFAMGSLLFLLMYGLVFLSGRLKPL